MQGGWAGGEAYRKLALPSEGRRRLPPIGLLPLVEVRAGSVALVLVEAWPALEAWGLVEGALVLLLLLIVAGGAVETLLLLLLLLLLRVVWTPIERVLRRFDKPTDESVNDTDHEDQ